jgi:hypothetical protein
MLTIFDDSDPWTAEVQRRYTTYIKLRKERDKFLKSLKPGWYGEWTIHKKLIEAGGLGDTVYILPARGCGTSFRTLKKINDLLEEGRDVQPVTLNKYEWPVLSKEDIERMRESVQQFHSYSELVNPYRRDPFYHELFESFYSKECWTLDPSWTIDPYGRVRLREVSLVRKEDLQCP